jgi:dihydrofolate reductase
MDQSAGKVFSALAVSVDGYITGRDPRAGQGLGDGGILFDWYFAGDTPSREFDGFRLSEASARVFDEAAARIGAVVVGRTTFEDSERFGGGSPHPKPPLVLLSHRAAEGLVDELILHQVPVLLGAGRPFFQELPEHIRLTVAEVVPADGVTHIRYEVQK